MHVHSVWTRPVQETLELIEKIVADDIVGFNLVYDWFHINKLYNTLVLFKDGYMTPQLHLKEFLRLEKKARDGVCLRPKSACDLMLHARKGPYQSTMDRKDIRIRRIPACIAHPVCEEISKRIKFKDIYFARRKSDDIRQWKVMDVKDEDGDIDPEFKDIVCSFSASSAMKTLYNDIYGEKQIDFDADAVPSVEEIGYAPYGLAVPHGGWQDYIETFITYWVYNSKAQKYAADDITITRKLWEWFGKPAQGDVDSELACCVGAVRWKGYTVDESKLRALMEAEHEKIKKVPKDPAKVREYLYDVLSKDEQTIVGRSTKRVVLESLTQGLWQEHPVSERAKMVLESRRADYAIKLIEKFLLAGRFHASFSIIGTRSSRMGGQDDLNAQGIPRRTDFRECFPLASDGQQLDGGDFRQFEVSLAEAVYNDAGLKELLLSGKKIHGLFGELAFPDYSYDEIMESEGTENDLYSPSKSGVFAVFYGGETYTLMNRLGIGSDEAERAYNDLIKRFPGIGIARSRTYDNFCSMRQPEGPGTRVYWNEPKDYAESLFGFRRYFTLENMICKNLFDLANNVPQSWKQWSVKVRRRDRPQTAYGAASSALYAAAFNLQAQNMRAAANHEIQSSGGEIAKDVQCSIWSLQPRGIHPWVVMPGNWHDEIEVAIDPRASEAAADIVKERVEHFRKTVNLLAIDWRRDTKSWAGTKAKK